MFGYYRQFSNLNKDRISIHKDVVIELYYHSIIHNLCQVIVKNLVYQKKLLLSGLSTYE